MTRPHWTEAQLTWQLIEEMAVRGADLLRPTFEQTKGKKGYLSVQTNPEFHKSPESLIAHALHLSKLAPNIQVKIPATAAGIAAIEEGRRPGGQRQCHCLLHRSASRSCRRSYRERFETTRAFESTHGSDGSRVHLDGR